MARDCNSATGLYIRIWLDVVCAGRSPSPQTHLSLADTIPPAHLLQPRAVTRGCFSTVFASPSFYYRLPGLTSCPFFPFLPTPAPSPPRKRSFLLSFHTLPKKLPLPNALLDLAVYPSTQASFLFGELHLQFFNCLPTKLPALRSHPTYSSQI